MNTVLDINLNSVKIALFTLGRKSRIKYLVKISKLRTRMKYNLLAWLIPRISYSLRLIRKLTARLVGSFIPS